MMTRVEYLLSGAMCLAAISPLPAAPHKITVYVVSNKVKYTHGPKDGDNGNVIVKDTEEVQWACDDNAHPCSSITIDLTDSLCSGNMHIVVSGQKPTASCIVSDGSTLRPDKYVINIDGAVDDPYVIVNNQGKDDHLPGRQGPKKVQPPSKR